ncbi:MULTISPECIES: glycoside hydrolase family 3 protein [unclassified Adlercreutzia]|uniref:glycoside hydrolase family 3 protein n=1 Tax=unclassified Adlercreutzia TaxID=2636013 RepID=UPI0013EC6000|nr:MULTISPECIES: glycoside hydrolase family 3 protein [unclassified Adlercreutzia]
MASMLDLRGAMSRRVFLVLCGSASAALLAGCSKEEKPSSHEDGLPDPSDVPESPGSGSDPGPSALSVDARLASMTLEEKVAQLFVVRPESLTGVEVVTQAGEATRSALMRRPVGGLVYFAQNLLDTAQTTEMLSSTFAYAVEAGGIPPFLGVDEEGGTVSRIGGNAGFGIANVGDMCAVGATGDANQAYAVAQEIARYLTPLGFNVDFAPVCDIANNPASDTMALRSFGSTPELVASMASAQVEGFSDGGIMCCAKHFPGIGAAVGDSHDQSIYSYKTRAEIEDVELVPFRAAMEAGVPLVMVGHLSMPSITGDDTPASISRDIVQGILRDELGYDGVVTTDSLAMSAAADLYDSAECAVRALEAGCDIPLMPADFEGAYQGVLAAVASGRLTEQRIDQSVRRILKAKAAAMPEYFAG